MLKRRIPVAQPSIPETLASKRTQTRTGVEKATSISDRTDRRLRTMNLSGILYY